GLPDRLRRDDADRIADLGQVARGQRAAVAELADPSGGLALQHRADRNADDRALLGVVLPSGDDVRKLGAIDLLALLDHHAPALCGDVARGDATDQVVVGLARGPQP